MYQRLLETTQKIQEYSSESEKVSDNDSEMEANMQDPEDFDQKKKKKLFFCNLCQQELANGEQAFYAHSKTKVPPSFFKNFEAFTETQNEFPRVCDEEKTVHSNPKRIHQKIRKA